MASAREMRLRIRSVENIAQVTRALEAVSASRVKKAEAKVRESRPYSDQAWQVLRHLSQQPARDYVHPLLTQRPEIRNVIVLFISGDRGLAGAYYTNVLRYTLEFVRPVETPLRYITVGKKGRDLLYRRGANILAEFSDLPADPSFADVSAIGRLVIEEYLDGRADQVFLVYTDFVNMLKQQPTHKLLLPLTYDEIPIGRNEPQATTPAERGGGPAPTYIYEPSEEALINTIVPRLTELQVYQAIMESLASEHAARMVAMRNATENAKELGEILTLAYNKARQQAITSDMLDIAGGAEALAQSRADRGRNQEV
jgi:F-type H+-transporting ATPase subunit gamma